MNIFKYLSIIFAISINGTANDWTGEKDFSHYHGPLDPRLKSNYQSEEVEFLDDYLNEQYINELISIDSFKLEEQYNSSIAKNFSCSVKELASKEVYLKYLVRLTAISSFYEYLRSASISLYQLSDETSCPLEHAEIFKACRPKTVDMKKFVKRSSDYFPDIVDWGRYPIKLSTDRRFSIKKYHPEFASVNSRYFSGIDKKGLVRACNYAKSEIVNLCNENDSYLSASKVKGLKQYIVQTSAFKMIDKDGKGSACYDRYESELADKEKISNKSVAILESSLKDDLRIFWYGSLKEFDQRGLTLVDVKEDKPIEKVTVAKALAPKEVEIDLDNIKIVRKYNPAPKPVEKPKKIVKVSEFEKSVANYISSQRVTELDMNAFKKDYSFSKKTLKKFNTSLRDYQTRKKLLAMKTVDDLGSAKAPMSLTFIKYLIDYNLHQGLYNMTGVLGREFYVFNDLEGKRRPVKIILDNNKSTKFKWKIWVSGL